MIKSFKCLGLSVLIAGSLFFTGCLSDVSQSASSSMSPSGGSSLSQSSVSSQSESQASSASLSLSFSSSQSPSSEAEWIPTIPKALFDYIGIGTNGHTVKQFAGVETKYPKQMLYKARIGEDGLAIFEYSSSEADGFITMIRIVDSTGERTITPSLDAYPFKDFVFERGVVSLKTPGRILESDFGIFGTIISDETVSTQGGEAFGSGEFLTRKMAFEKISLTLVQYSRDLHTDRWSIWEMSIKDPGFANTRGIAVGLSLTETLQKISNGEFGYSMNLDNGKIRSIDIKKFSEEYVYMTLEFEEDKIAEIRIEFAAP